MKRKQVKKYKCQQCRDTRRTTYRGRSYVCGACATDVVSMAFQKAIKETVTEKP